jgi:hypothetical protein
VVALTCNPSCSVGGGRRQPAQAKVARPWLSKNLKKGSESPAEVGGYLPLIFEALVLILDIGDKKQHYLYFFPCARKI